MLNPWANAKAFPSSKYGAISSLYNLACFSSGTKTITTSEDLTAFATVATSKPASLTLSQDLLPSYNPTTTSTPLSWRFNACACPWLP